MLDKPKLSGNLKVFTKKITFTHFMVDQLIERSAVLREMQMKIYIFRDVT
jgi:hypothetical protein